MDIDPSESVASLLREASSRIDGRAAYAGMAIFFFGGVIRAIHNLSIGETSFFAWKLVIASMLMVPITLILYFSLATFSAKGRLVSRLINAAILILFPVYFYTKLL